MSALVASRHVDARHCMVIFVISAFLHILSCIVIFYVCRIFVYLYVECTKYTNIYKCLKSLVCDDILSTMYVQMRLSTVSSVLLLVRNHVLPLQ